MSEPIQLHIAKYKGVEFLFFDTTTTGGGRFIKLNYPGSDKQSMERQGARPRSYSIIIVIPHEDYMAVKLAVLRMLDSEGPDTLTHPFFGDVPNMVPGVWEITEGLSRLGRAEVTVTFEVDDGVGVPVEVSNLPAQVAGLSGTLRDQLTGDLADSFDADKSLSGVFTDALDAVTGAIDAVADAADLVLDPTAEELAKIRASTQSLTASVGDLVQAPAELAAAFDGLLADLHNLSEAPRDLRKAFEALAGYGDDDPVVAPTTVARVRRSENRALIRADIRVLALAYLYSDAPTETFGTTDDLEATQDSLEVVYVDAKDNQLLTNEAIEALDRLRVSAQASLDAERVSTPRVITVETTETPLSVLVYRYYGSTELFETVAALNNINQNAFVSGSVKLLSA